MNPAFFSAFPKHMFHATSAPLIAHNAEEQAKAEADGYGFTYIPQEYPKYVGPVVVHNAVQEAAAIAQQNSQGAPLGLEADNPAPAPLPADEPASSEDFDED